MNDFLFFVFKVLIFAIVILWLTLGVYLLTSYKHTVELIFSKEKPKMALFSLKKTEESDRFYVYYIARLFAICVIAFFVIVIFLSFIRLK